MSCNYYRCYFKTGYLTIKSYDSEKRLYRLSYPNYEVEIAFLERLLNAFGRYQAGFSEGHLWRMVDALRAGDLEAFFEILKVFFANIPYDIQLPYEKYYQTIFYLIFALIGLRIDAEKRTQRGRIDTVIEFDDQIYLFEFKLNDSAAAALAQIHQKGYADGYRHQAKTLHLVGVGFDSEQRSISDWILEAIPIEPETL